MPTSPRKARRGDRSINTNSYNSMVSYVSQQRAGSTSRVGEIKRSRTQAYAVLAEGAIGDIKPFSPCRIIKRIELTDFDAESATYTVAPLNNTESEGFPMVYGYAFAGQDGISEDNGGVITISGIAEVHVTRKQIYDGFRLGADAESMYEGIVDSMYYVVPDRSITNMDTIAVAPTGHFKIIGMVRSEELGEELEDSSTMIKLIVDMNRSPSTIVVDVQTSINPATYDAETKVFEMPSAQATVLEVHPYSDEWLERHEKRKLKNESKQEFQVSVFNDTDGVIAGGRHKAVWSTEYNCFLIIAVKQQSTFLINMEWQDPDAAGNTAGDGGLQGTFNTPASWTYDISLFEGDGTVIEADVDIIAPPHHYRRPNGQMNKATYGLATYNSAGDLVVISCNETIIGATC